MLTTLDVYEFGGDPLFSKGNVFLLDHIPKKHMVAPFQEAFISQCRATLFESSMQRLSSHFKKRDFGK